MFDVTNSFGNTMVHDMSLTQEAKEKLAALNLTLRRPVCERAQYNSKHIKSSLECDYCEYKSTNKDHVVAHELQNHRGTKQKCTECDYSNYLSSKIRKHYKQVHLKIPRQSFPHSCDECDFKTEMVNGSTTLKHHKESVHEGIVFICNICPNYRTNKRKTFQQHNLCHNANSHSKKEGNVRLCAEDKCSYKTNKNHRMIKHKEAKHEGIVHHRCDFMNCSYGTSWKENLNKHMVQHTGVYPFNCATCKKGFMRR